MIRLQAAMTVCALGVAVLLAAAAAGQLSQLMPRVSHTVLAASAFLCLVVGLATCMNVALLSARHDWGLILTLGATAAGLFVAARLGFAGARHVSGGVLGVIASAAWVEEVVFRRLLPRAVTSLLDPLAGKGSAVAGVLFCQLLFAVSHFGPGAPHTSFSLAGAARLFGGGLLFAVIASRAGLTVAALAHALLNLRLTMPQVSPGAPPLSGIQAIALLALAVMLIPSPSTHTQPHTPRSAS